MLVERNVVAEFDVPLKEHGCLYVLVLWNIARKVLHEHAACDLAVGDNMEMLDGLNVAKEITVVVRCAEHAALRGDLVVLAPLFGLDIAAVVVGVARLESEQVAISHLGFYI